MQIDSNNWRKTSSKEAYSLILDNYKRFGISRIASITHLDVLGFPVYVGIRTGAKSLSVSAGKGMNHVDSIVSAAMEAIETHAAEFLDPKYYYIGCYEDLPSDNRLPFEMYPANTYSHFNKRTIIAWLKLTGQITTNSIYYPAMLVTLDWASAPDSIGIFSMSSNGLASGINRTDAILSGLYEVIERDAIACWQYFHVKHRFPYSSLIESTIPFSSTQSLIKRIKESSLDLIVIPLFTDFEIPIYQCLLLNSADAANAISIGYGCHHSDEIAMNRAITEAAQGRAVTISGSRDDIIYHSLRSSDAFDIDNFKSQYLPECFNNPPCLHSKADDLLQDLLLKIGKLELHEPLYFSFANTEPFSVVRVIMPSLAPYLGKGTNYSLYSKHPRVTSFRPKPSGINALFL